MAQPNQCDGCSQADRCQEAYRQLGCTEGPSVTRPVLIAFLLPIVAFIVSLAAWSWLLEGAGAGPYRTPAALILALAVTAGLMGTVRLAARRRARK